MMAPPTLATSCAECGNPVLAVQLPGGRDLQVELTEVLDAPRPGTVMIAVDVEGNARTIHRLDDTESGEGVHLAHTCKGPAS